MNTLDTHRQGRLPPRSVGPLPGLAVLCQERDPLVVDDKYNSKMVDDTERLLHVVRYLPPSLGIGEQGGLHHLSVSASLARILECPSYIYIYLVKISSWQSQDRLWPSFRSFQHELCCCACGRALICEA